MTGNSAGANHLAELDSHLEAHVAELRRRAQAVRDELVAEVDALSQRIEPHPPQARALPADGPLLDDEPT